MDFPQRVKDPKAIADCTPRSTGLQVVGARPDIGSVALGDKERGYAIILLRDDSTEHPERLAMHFEVGDVDAEYNRLKKLGVQFDEPPGTSPGVGVTPIPTTQQGTRSNCARRLPTRSSRADERGPFLKRREATALSQ
jgi:hypothetical protein